jgi:haloalkane dehalogenase
MPIENVLRTPCPTSPNSPHYVNDLPDYDGLRAHYLDLGPKEADRTFLCLHGEPTWSYLYRKMIPVLVESGARVVAPDFLGLTLPLDAGFRAALDRLLLMNTSLPVGEPLAPHFYAWRSLVRTTPDLPVGDWVRQSTPHLTDAEAAAYDAPFPDRRYQAGARTFPDLAMVEPDMEGVAEARAAAAFWADDWSGESFVAIGANDPDVAAIHALRQQIRGCPEPLVLDDAGHFVPESGDVVARAALRAFGDL